MSIFRENQRQTRAIGKHAHLLTHRSTGAKGIFSRKASADEADLTSLDPDQQNAVRTAIFHRRAATFRPKNSQPHLKNSQPRTATAELLEESGGRTRSRARAIARIP